MSLNLMVLSLSLSLSLNQKYISLSNSVIIYMHLTNRRKENGCSQEEKIVPQEYGI